MIIISVILFLATVMSGVGWLIRHNNGGYYESHLVLGTLFWVFGVVGFFFMVGCIHLEPSEQLVSGVVYNTKSNGLISGNTSFSVRAAVDTYVSEENQSSYCLPPGSPYIPLVQKAAADKTIKVVVTTKKDFEYMAPWRCMSNVTVTEVK